MWKASLISLFLFLGTLKAGAEDFKCGEYEISGVIKKVEGKFALKLYEGSMSEVVLSLSPDLEELAGIYENRAVLLRGRMSAPVSLMRGKVDSLLSAEELRKLTAPDQPYSARFLRSDIKERVPDPLHPDLDSGLKLIKEMACGERAPAAKKTGKSAR